MIVILGMWRNSGETTEVRMEGAVSLSCFPLQENGAFRISSLLVGLLYLHHGPHTAFRIDLKQLEIQGEDCIMAAITYARLSLLAAAEWRPKPI